MECVVWAVEKAKDCDSDTETDEDTESDEEPIVEDEEGTLREKEKEAIRSLSPSNPMAADENTFATSTDEEEPCGDGASCTSIDVFDVLKEAAACAHIDSCDTGRCSAC